MKKRTKLNNKDRNQLAFDLNGIMEAFEDSFIIKLKAYFTRLTNKILKKADSLVIFKKSIEKTDKKDVIELKNLFSKFYKQVGKESVVRLNDEIKHLSGISTKIKIPDINEGLRYRAEILALKKTKDFRDTIIEKIKASEGNIKDKKELIKTVKKASNLFANRNISVVARMESVNAVNTARIEAGNKSTIIKGWQFLAVLDKRTTDICKSRHLKVLRKDDPRVRGSFRPPCHWGCRSLLSPVTIFEDIAFSDEIKLNSVPDKNFGKSKDNSLDQTKIEQDFFAEKKEKSNKVLSDKELSKVVKEQEKRIIEVSKNKYEIMSAFDIYGNNILTKAGTDININFTNIETNILLKEAKVITHNHPNGSTFSPNDLRLAFESLNVFEIRVISKNIKDEGGVHSLKNIAKISEKNKKTMVNNYNYLYNDIKKQVDSGIIKGSSLEITEFTLNVMDIFKKEYDLDYLFIKDI